MSGFVNPDGSALIGGLLPSGIGEALQFDTSGNLKTTGSGAGAGTTLVTTGGASTTAIAAAGSANIKAAPGRLFKVLITTVGTAALTFYDNAAGGATGTIIGLIAANAAIGTIADFQMPAAVGISAVGGAGSPAVTVSWS